MVWHDHLMERCRTGNDNFRIDICAAVSGFVIGNVSILSMVTLTLLIGLMLMIDGADDAAVGVDCVAVVYVFSTSPMLSPHAVWQHRPCCLALAGHDNVGSISPACP